MPQTRPLGAQISHMLKARGVDVIFGIPGVHNQEMYRGIQEAGITHVLARHEQGAGFMADGYARASGKPGVAYVITGPGLCNIMTPMGQAYSDSVPMLVISSCLDEVAATRGQLHQMKDQRTAAQTVCDWSEEARSPEAAFALIDRALGEMAIGRARPKHIQVPIALLEGAAGDTWGSRPIQGPRPIPAEPDWIDYAAMLLGEAKRPLFVFGGGARQLVGLEIGQTRPALLERVLAKTGAATFTTYAGRGIVPAEYPLSFGANLARASSADVIASADLVIAIGTELAEVDIWRADLGHSARLLRVDIDDEVLSQNVPQQYPIRADAFAFMADLDRALTAQAPGSGWQAKEVATSKARWRAEVDAERPGILPVVEALKAATPEGTMIYSDMTQIAYLAKEVWDMDRPGHWHHPYGFGTLGYATPAAIGGAIARPGLPSMAIIGDYGFHYTMQELGVAVELGLPLPIILWDNAKLGEIEDSMVRAQIAPNAVIARNPDFCKLAEAFGAAAVRPKTLADIAPALTAAFNAEGPTLIYLTPALTA